MTRWVIGPGSSWERMVQNPVWFVLLTLSVFANTSAVKETTFGFHPDRDNIGVFTLRIPISFVSPKELNVSESVPREAAFSKKPDSLNAKIENDEGFICAEERESHSLEISKLPCDHCMNGKLLVTIETKKGNEILSKTQTILSDESKRAEICNLRQEKQKQGEDLVVTSPKQKSEDGCRWAFRDAGGFIGCCYSNRDYYTQTGGCDPRMQSSACRKGSESPILREEQNSCTFLIENLRPADSGNYLSNFIDETPGFKKVLTVEGDGEILSSGNLMICLAPFLLLGVLTVFYLYLHKTTVSSLIKRALIEISSSEKAKTAELQDEVKKLSPPDHVA